MFDDSFYIILPGHQNISLGHRPGYALVLASFPGLHHFCSSVFVQYNTQKWKSTKNGEGLGAPITRMTSGGREVDIGEEGSTFK